MVNKTAPSFPLYLKIGVFPYLASPPSILGSINWVEMVRGLVLGVLVPRLRLDSGPAHGKGNESYGPPYSTRYG